MNTTQSPDQLAPETVQAQRAAIAVGLAPLLVLLAFTAVVIGFIEPDIGVAIFAACTAWVVYEMYRYQDSIESSEEAAGPWL
jgi:hypothetical protein